MPIIGLPKSWTPGTNGTFTAPTSCGRRSPTPQDAEKWRGKLRGKIVLTQPAREVRMLEGPIVLRYADDPKWIEEALSMPPARGAGAGRAAGAAGAGAARRAPGWWRGWRRASRRGRRRRRGGGGPAPFNVNTFYREEGVLALFDRGANSDMTRRRQRPDVADAARGRRHDLRVSPADRRRAIPRRCCRRSRSRSSTTTAWSGCSSTTRR